MRPFQIFATMSPERAVVFCRALADEAPTAFAQSLALAAGAFRMRPVALKRLPFEKRAKKARSLIEGKHNAELAYELFGTYLVTTKKDLVTAFLDATGVPHEDGMIQNPDASTPDESKLEDAVVALDAAHDPADVTLYLAIAAEQWPESALLQRIWRERGTG